MALLYFSVKGKSRLRLMEQLEPGAALYGRADYRPLLSPLDFRDASGFASSGLDPEQKLRRFAVLGGTRGRVKEVLKSVERDLDIFMGRAFEDCCRGWVGRYAGDALPASQQLGCWWSRDGQTEIDVVGVSRGRYDLLAFCKWDRKAPSTVLGQLLAHRDAVGRAGSAQLAIFARGFAPELERRAKEEEVALIGVDRLFE